MTEVDKTVFLEDNGWVLEKVSKKCIFIKRVYNQHVYYFAANRAARKALQSNKFNKLGVEISLELNAFS